MEELEWKDSLLRILEKDSRYDAHAYIFMNNAVSYTVNKLSKQGRPLGTRHVSGAQLIQGMLEYAVSTYMFLAPDMLRYWNLLSGRDAGNIVYNLIEDRRFEKTGDISLASLVKLALALQLYDDLDNLFKNHHNYKSIEEIINDQKD